MKTPSPSLAAVLLPLTLAACGGSPSESTGTTAEAFTMVGHQPMTLITATHASATGTSVTISVDYMPPAPAGWTVSLAGPDGTLSVPMTPAAATFTGLVECTPFTFTILDGSGTSTGITGSIHTSAPGGGACLLSDTRTADKGMMFQGAFHTHTNNAWCSESNWADWLLQYPLDQPGWAYAHSVGMTETNTGHQHYWNPGAQPLPCGEQFVEVSRSKFVWSFDESQRRRAQTTHVVATVNTASACVSHFSNTSAWYEAQTQAEQNAESDDHNTWWGGSLIGEPFGGIISYESDAAPVTVTGNALTADVTPMLQQQGYVAGGFVDANDGFPSDPNWNASYAEDNDTCEGYLVNVALATTYAPVQPDTPLNCTASVNCQEYTVTCDGAPEQFRVINLDSVHQDAWDMGHYQGVTGTRIVMTGLQILPADLPIEVCTVSGDLQTCTPPIPETYTACPPTKGQSGGGTGGPLCPPGGCKLQ